LHIYLYMYIYIYTCICTCMYISETSGIASYMHCNVLQHTATHDYRAIFFFLQQQRHQGLRGIRIIATHYNTLQRTTTHYNTMQHNATHCNTLQHTAIHCNTLQHTATHRNTLQHMTRAGSFVICTPETSGIVYVNHCNALQDTATYD